MKSAANDNTIEGNLKRIVILRALFIIQNTENVLRFALSKLSPFVPQSVRGSACCVVRYGFRGNIIFAPQGVHAPSSFLPSFLRAGRRIINDFFLPIFFSSSTVVWGNNYLAVSSILSLAPSSRTELSFKILALIVSPRSHTSMRVK